MRRMVRPTGLLDGREIGRVMDEMEDPCDEATSRALFERFMARLAEQERRHRRARQLSQLVRAALAAAMTGAGAYRLLTR
jgi:hypothetical protein